MSYVYGLSQKLDETRSASATGPSRRSSCAQQPLRVSPRAGRALSYPASMQPFLRLIAPRRQRSSVTSIQITIYRLAKDAKLIDFLCLAAENGKEVLVLIGCAPALTSRTTSTGRSEFGARAGCQVIYGFRGFKYTPRVCLICIWNTAARVTSPRCPWQLQRKTAAQYTDLSLITADRTSAATPPSSSAICHRQSGGGIKR